MSDYTRWRPEFAKALDPARYTIEWVDAQLEAGLYLLDATDKAAIITAQKVWPTGNWDVEGIIAAGDPEEIVNTLIPYALARGRMCGAIGGHVASRPAWVRLLKPLGFEVDQITVRKDLRG